MCAYIFIKKRLAASHFAELRNEKHTTVSKSTFIRGFLNVSYNTPILLLKTGDNHPGYRHICHTLTFISNRKTKFPFILNVARMVNIKIWFYGLIQNPILKYLKLYFFRETRPFVSKFENFNELQLL